jgi:hypothetical protein
MENLSDHTNVLALREKNDFLRVPSLLLGKYVGTVLVHEVFPLDSPGKKWVSPNKCILDLIIERTTSRSLVHAVANMEVMLRSCHWPRNFPPNEGHGMLEIEVIYSKI